ncbi:hypothetical protein [Cellvibrio sp. KY-YJ-3]|jgi:hypothetical protein|uniref:hypothetical protein n=1 Tax=Cellvibrio sp. KY-YJ-3 TaxID=454662 RepID=UPI0012439CBC|nr:hypothetical protein [Cellvibrio sp. KY-YJ-3]QEY13467.1 hypothetical protein D0B88_15160 [Cellvibrio sp. KY-YJ-3]
METCSLYLTATSIVLGLISAASWLRASVIKVSHEKAMKNREKEAGKRGESPNYASVSLDGWDMSATFSAQSKWNAAGAFFAASSILLQAIAQILENV